MSEPRTPGRAWPPRKLLPFSAAALVVLTLLGLGRLWEPPAGDQALFLLGASALHSGGVLYRDFWDLKQPGIFEFYLAAGMAFGFTPQAVHLLELVLWLVLGIAQIAALGPSLRRPLLATVAPLVTGGAFYLSASIHDFGQPEALAGAPLFLSLWLFLESFEAGRRALPLVCAAGLLAGLAILGKLLFGFIAFALLAAAIAGMAPLQNRWLWRLGIYSCAALLPPAAYLAVAAAQHEFAAVVYTWFVLPRDIMAALPNAPATRLFQNTRTYLTTFALPLAFAALVPVSPFTPRARIWRNAMFAWIATAAAVIVVQRFSWWEYHFMLFVVPVGVLATLGCDALVERLAELRAKRRLAALSVAVCIALVAAGPPFARTAHGMVSLVTAGVPFSSAKIEHYRRLQSIEYGEAAEVAASLPRRGGAKSIFVAGDPLVLILSGTVSHVPINGWGLELLLPRQWRMLRTELLAARPADIFIEPDYAPLIARQSPGIERWLRRDYRLGEQSRLGSWYAALPRAGS